MGRYNVWGNLQYSRSKSIKWYQTKISCYKIHNQNILTDNLWYKSSELTRYQIYCFILSFMIFALYAELILAILQSNYRIKLKSANIKPNYARHHGLTLLVGPACCRGEHLRLLHQSVGIRCDCDHVHHWRQLLQG